MKRFLWALSGIIATVLLLFNSGSSASATEFKNILGYSDIAGVNVVFHRGTSLSLDGSALGYYLYTFTDTSVDTIDSINRIDLMLSPVINFSSGQQFSLSFSITTSNLFFSAPACPRTTSASPYVFDNCEISFSAFSQPEKVNGTFSDVYIFNFLIDGHFTGSGSLGSSTPFMISLSPLSFNQVHSISLPSIAFKFSAFTLFTTTDSSSSAITGSINSAANQAHKDSQAQLDFEKEQAKKEEEQRKQDEERDKNTGDNSQQSSENSQSDIDSSTTSLFEIMNSVKDSIMGSRAGSCSISGDFGFFNAGSINLCTGNSAVVTITTVCGTVMLFFFLFKTVLSILHAFLELYNDSFK